MSCNDSVSFGFKSSLCLQVAPADSLLSSLAASLRQGRAFIGAPAGPLVHAFAAGSGLPRFSRLPTMNLRWSSMCAM